MPRLPDVIGGVPQPETMYSRQPVVQAREVTAPIGQADENLAGAVGQAGQAITKYGEQQADQQKALDIVRADATHQQNLNDLQRSFESDTDYTTQAQRFQDQANSQLAANAAGIQDPQARALWMAKATAANQTAAQRVQGGADTMVKQGKAVDLSNSLDKYQSTLQDPATTDAQRADALSHIKDGIAINQQSGLLDPRTADTLTKKYAVDGPAVAAQNMQRRDPEGFIQRYYQPGASPAAKTMTDELKVQGASDSAIRGILANVRDESNFDPTLSHPDQTNPKFAGTEAQNAHGLFQLGGGEWNKYDAWLKTNAPAGADWKDPKLQTQFLVQNLKADYPDVWRSMQSGTPEQAAMSFVSGYLKPASRYEAARRAKYAQGIPDADTMVNSSGGKLNLPSWADSLSPLDRQQLIDSAHSAIAKRNSDDAAAANAQMDSDIQRVLATGQVLRDADGKTSIDRARDMGLPVEKQQRAINAAQLDYNIRSDLPNLTEDEANARIAKLSEFRSNPDVDFRAVDATAKRAQKQLDGIVAQRQHDPHAAATGNPHTGEGEAQEVAQVKAALSNPAPVQQFDGSFLPAPAPNHTQVTQALVKASLAAQDRWGVPPDDQRIISHADAQRMLDLGVQNPKDLSNSDFRGKINAAMARAQQAYGPEAQRAFEDAAKIVLKDYTYRQTAIGMAARLMAGGDITHADVMTLRDARTIDPMANLIQSITPRADVTLGLPAAAVNMPGPKPGPQAVQDLKSRPDSWPGFDRVYGAGAAARALGFANAANVQPAGLPGSMSAQ